MFQKSSNSRLLKCLVELRIKSPNGIAFISQKFIPLSLFLFDIFSMLVYILHTLCSVLICKFNNLLFFNHVLLYIYIYV